MSEKELNEKKVELTPYECSKVVNLKLKEIGIQKVLPPQMFYNYVNKGYIKSEKGLVDFVVLKEWFDGYVVRLSQRIEKQNRELPKL